MLEEDELRDAVVLVLANKQDLPNAMTAEEMEERLELKSIESHRWSIIPCSALSGEGLYKGLVTETKTNFYRYLKNTHFMFLLSGFLLLLLKFFGQSQIMSFLF
eukprot:UN17293